MVKDLPRGALEWSGEFLEKELEQCLASSDTTGSVWSASAYVLASERRANWIDYLGEALQRSKELRTKPQPTFWNMVECCVYLAARDDREQKDRLDSRLRELLDQFAGTEAEDGLRRVFDTLVQVGPAET